MASAPPSGIVSILTASDIGACRLFETVVPIDGCSDHALVAAGDLDDAVLDRMDEALEFGLPRADERKKMLDLYMDKCVAHI